MSSDETFSTIVICGGQAGLAVDYCPGYTGINLPVFDESGRPRHERGVVRDAPGMYFVGLHFQTGLTSSLLGGVGADARDMVRRIS